MEVIQTDRLRVRTINNQDHERFFLLQGDPAVMRFIRPIKTREESDKALNEMLASGEPEEGGRWMVEEKDSNRFAGTLAIIPVPYDTTKIQLGYALVPGCWARDMPRNWPLPVWTISGNTVTGMRFMPSRKCPISLHRKCC